jgi:tRNA (mo5U34)-methyltransferase
VHDVEYATSLVHRAGDFAAAIGEVKAGSRRDDFWHPADLMLNLRRLDELMEQAACVLDSLVRELPIADIGGGDGDCAFFFASLGHHVHLIDHAPTNYNKLEGARALKNELGSSVEIIDLDIEQGLRLPAPRYGLVLFLGVLHRLKNPYQVLEELSQLSRHCFLSTRVARFAPDGTKIGRLPVAYLLEEGEIDDDPTNYWIFSPAGLRLLLRRTNWEIVAKVIGGSEPSEPVRPDGDARAFMLLRSRSQMPWYYGSGRPSQSS